VLLSWRIGFRGVHLPSLFVPPYFLPSYAVLEFIVKRGLPADHPPYMASPNEARCVLHTGHKWFCRYLALRRGESEQSPTVRYTKGQKNNLLEAE
jgi:hypothetical protein